MVIVASLMLPAAVAGILTIATFVGLQSFDAEPLPRFAISCRGAGGALAAAHFPPINGA
jgi:hypothetical protein